jgi:hypothetical protein
VAVDEEGKGVAGRRKSLRGEDAEAIVVVRLWLLAPTLGETGVLGDPVERRDIGLTFRRPVETVLEI